MDIIEEFKELVMIDSASGQERAIADVLTAKLRALGFTVTEDRAGDTFGGNTGNLTAVREGDRPGAILFCSHMDRVANGLHIRPREKDGCLVSDGTTILAADDVSGICAILDGVRRALASRKPLPRLEIAFTVGEESGLWGGRALDLSRFQSPFCYVMDSPGTLGRLINGAPGLAKLQAEILGKAAHAGNEPEKGINAAHILCHILDTLKDGRLDEETVANFPLMGTGNTATNIVCDRAWVKGESRSRNREKLEAYMDYFQRHCQEAAAGTGARVRTAAEISFAPFHLAETEPVIRTAVKALEALGIAPRIEQGGGGMDANIFNAKGLPSLGVATGYTKNHTLEENLDLKSFIRSGQLVEKLIGMVE